MLKTLKWIAIGIVLACVTSIAVSGTLADDDADNKRLSIVHLELERYGNGLTEVIKGKDLLPVTDTLLNKENVTLSQEFAMVDKNGNSSTFEVSFSEEMYTASNALDHIVMVRNCGNVTGQVRTWFAFEMGDLTAEEFESAVVLNRNTDDWEWSNFEYGVLINGERYAVVRAELKVGLKAGEVTPPSLMQILLHSEVDSETAERLDGNYDLKYMIFSHSQAVSDKGAWGEIAKPWIAGQNNTYPPQ